MNNPTTDAVAERDTEFASLLPENDRWRVRFVRTLRHPPEKVWRAITEPEHLAAWFPSTIDGERRAGAALRFVFKDFDGDPLDGRMLVFDPPHRLELLWGEDLLRITLAPTADGGCTLTFDDVLVELGKAARDGAGWHACLARFGRLLDGSDAPLTEEEQWPWLNPQYQQRFGPAASTVGPPKGHPAAEG